MQVACLLILEDKPLNALAESCLRFSSQVAVGERAVFIEIGRSHRVYSPQSLLPRLQALARRFGIKMRVAFADDIPTALALATFNARCKRDLPIEALQIYANPFRPSNSLEGAITSFKRLGVTRLQDFMDLPVKSLAARFGKEGLLVRHHVDSVLSLPWPRFEPAEEIVETVNIDDAYSVRDLEPMMFLLKGLVDRALLRLRGRGKVALSVELSLIQENFSTVKSPRREFPVEFAFAQGSVISVLPILRERLERELAREPLASPLRSMEFSIVKTAPGQARQKDFFCKKEEEEESFQSVMSRLRDRLGSHRAFLASPVESYAPENSWRKTLTHVSKIEMKVAERPLRVLKKPQTVRRLDDYLIHRHKKWRINEIIGPERLGGEWWAGSSESGVQTGERDYYRVKTSSGEELWVFTTPRSTDYYLHGIFD